MSEKPTNIQRKGQLTPLVIREEKSLGSPRFKSTYTRPATSELCNDIL